MNDIIAGPAAPFEAGLARPLPHSHGYTEPRQPGPRLRIAVDFDGVLFDHIPYVLRGFRDAHGIDLQAEGFRYWDFFQYRAIREGGLTWNCVRAVLDRIETDDALHQQAPHNEQASQVIRAWRAAGHHVTIATAREPASRAATEAFLRVHGIEYDELVLGASRKTGYDVLIDDAPHNVLMAAADGGLALLMDQPYNQDVPTRGNPVRVRDWREVDDQVRAAFASPAVPPLEAFAPEIV